MGGSQATASSSLPSATADAPAESAEAKELAQVQRSMADAPVVGPLVGLARTPDQARALMTFGEATAEKSLRATVALTAGRGRGKSAALGLALASAIGFGYANVFVTAPSPENLRTVFEFLFRGLKALGYEEHSDFSAVASSGPSGGGGGGEEAAIVRVDISRHHRQTVQYIHPTDAAKLSQCELLAVDEAAAIPLPVVRSLLGPYLVFLSSTVNGYEGTGRALSLKLIGELRKQAASAGMAGSSGAGGAGSSRSFREIELKTPIRYSLGDPVEGWMNRLLCLDAAEKPYRLSGALPPPSACELFHVNRDSLFSHHRLSEALLQRAVQLLVASHYKNSPNDLQLLADAPAQRLFVLLAPPSAASQSSSPLPDVLCVVQVCLEGAINREAARAALAKGHRAPGDLIPWTVSQQFQAETFPELSGVRVVRIATHPDAQGMGYGRRALGQLRAYFEGKAHSVGASEGDSEDGTQKGAARSSAGTSSESADESSQLLSEEIAPRKQLPPLLTALADRPPETVQYLGVSFGLTSRLFAFWQRAGYVPVYVRQTSNELTGEHTCIMIRPLRDSAPDAGASSASSGAGGSATAGASETCNAVVKQFAGDFARRFTSLLPGALRRLEAKVTLQVLDAAVAATGAIAPEDSSEESAASGGSGSGVPSEAAAPAAPGSALSAGELLCHVTSADMRRLAAYSRQLVDYHMVVDLMPALARLALHSRLATHGGSFSRLQQLLLAGVGLQLKSIDELGAELHAPASQLLAVFNKSVKKATKAFEAVLAEGKQLGLEAGGPSRGSGSEHGARRGGGGDGAGRPQASSRGGGGGGGGDATAADLDSLPPALRGYAVPAAASSAAAGQSVERVRLPRSPGEVGGKRARTDDAAGEGSSESWSKKKRRHEDGSSGKKRGKRGGKRRGGKGGGDSEGRST